MKEKLKELFSTPLNILPHRIGYHLNRISPAIAGGRFSQAEITFDIEKLFGKGAINIAAPAKSPDFAKELQAIAPETYDKILEQAKMVLDHHFKVLGYQENRLGHPVDWHTDFISGVSWNARAKHHQVFSTASGNGGDVKIPWELSRFHFLCHLGIAFKATGDEAFARKAVELIDDWIRKNPSDLGINWACSMEVAIRALNWLVGLQLIRDAKSLDEKFQKKVVKSLAAHGAHIRQNMEMPATNHRFADAVGLLALGVSFSGNKTADSWRALATKEIKREMILCLQKDGTLHEGSTGYHLLVTEMALIAKRLFDLTKTGADPEFIAVLEKMSRSLMILKKPDARTPQIGDYDSGRILPFGLGVGMDPERLSALSKAAGACRGNEKISSEKWVDAFSLFGNKAKKTLEKNRESGEKQKNGFFNYPDSGWYGVRNNETFLFISAGKSRSHSHNDMLSFELCVDGEDLFIDPGTYLYTPDPSARKLLRSTDAHNTLSVNGQEQRRFLDDGVFGFKDTVKTEVLKWENSCNRYLFIGSHNGYKRLDQNVTHQRKIEIYPGGSLEIDDQIFGRGKGKVKITFILGPKVEVKKKKKNTIALSVGELDGLLRFETESEPIIEEMFCSREYGEKIATKRIYVESEMKFPANIKTLVTWKKGAKKVSKNE